MKTKIDIRLIGTWRSDRIRTIQHWMFPKRVAAKKRKELEKLFGQKVWRFTRSRAYLNSGGSRSSCSYEILWSGIRSAVVLFKDRDGEYVQHIYFDGNYLYMLAGLNVEFFRKVRSG